MLLLSRWPWGPATLNLVLVPNACTAQIAVPKKKHNINDNNNDDNNDNGDNDNNDDNEDKAVGLKMCLTIPTAFTT